MIEWHKGKKRLTYAAVKHGIALRWQASQGDAQLTPDSAEWIMAWLARHGVRGPQDDLEAIRTQRNVEGQARPRLRQFVPTGYIEAIQRAKTDARSRKTAEESTDSLDQRGKCTDKYLRAAFSDSKAMYIALFRIMGCLPMHWDARYEPEQTEAYDFLVRAPRDELDQAVRAAVCSKDAAELQGAARVVFSQFYMTLYGNKSDRDVLQWRVLLADAAYNDPFPENRRLVLRCVSKYVDAPVLAVLERAVADPDATVRRIAIHALALRREPESQQILRRVFNGAIRPRAAAQLPTDFGLGSGGGFATPGMEADTILGTDIEAARAALKASK